MGVRRCLARFLTSLALLRTPKSANGPRSNSFRPDSPFTTTYPRGRKTQTDSPTTPDMVRSGRVLPTSVKSPSTKNSGQSIKFRSHTEIQYSVPNTVSGYQPVNLPLI